MAQESETRLPPEWRRRASSRSCTRPSSTSSPTCAATAGTSPRATSSTSASAAPRAATAACPGGATRCWPRCAPRAGCPTGCRSSRSRGTRTSCAGRRRGAWPAPRFCLVGDAAGLARDLSGEGIGPAIRSGRLAAAAVQRAPPRGARRSTATRGEIVARYGPGEPGWLGRQLGRLPGRAGAAGGAGGPRLGGARGVASCSTRSSACERWRHDAGRSKERRRRGDRAPLRRLERVLRAVPRPADGLHLRVLPRPRRQARAGAGGQARSGLPQAAAAAGRDRARHRLRLGEPRHLGRPALRRPRPRRDALEGAGRVGGRADQAGGARGPVPGRVPRLPGPARGRALRQDRGHRRHRARGHPQLPGLLRAGEEMLVDGGSTSTTASTTSSTGSAPARPTSCTATSSPTAISPA